MACTTLLVGKGASYDGSTIIARNEDSPSGVFEPKKFIVVEPEDQPRHYKSVLAHTEIELPDDPMRYTAMPNAIDKEGIWGAAGVNAANVAMTATETITTNERVRGADPFVEFVPGKGKPGEEGYVPEQPGGISEEDLVTITLPYISSAHEGVERLGSLLERYGTYEMNGIAFSDTEEIWWLETIGGHHWIARRVPDDSYVTMPNQLGIDEFDLDDAFGAQESFMCSADLREFIADNHLDLSLDGRLNPRDAFGSHSDADHVYNTPRAWAIQRFLNPTSNIWDGPDADYRPEDDDIPWCRVPERKVTIEDVKYALSLHYQGTPYDPYGTHGDKSRQGMYRPIGINRNSHLHIIQLRPYEPDATRAVEWIAFGSNAFNAIVPFYANVDSTPDYLANTTARVTTESFYWANRIVAGLADAHFSDCLPHIERYQESVPSHAYEVLHRTDAHIREEKATYAEASGELAEANQEIAAMLRLETDDLLDHVLYTASNGMRNGFSRSDS